MSGIDLDTAALTRMAHLESIRPELTILAREATRYESSRSGKLRALAELQARFARGTEPPHIEEVSSMTSSDADDVCLFVAAAALSLGIPCRFVAARYGQNWTCQLAYEIEGRWNQWVIVDRVAEWTTQVPDEEVTGEPMYPPRVAVNN